MFTNLANDLGPHLVVYFRPGPPLGSVYPSESLASDVNQHLFSTWLDYEPTYLFFVRKHIAKLQRHCGNVG